jgi:hypothetical protein
LPKVGGSPAKAKIRTRAGRTRDGETNIKVFTSETAFLRDSTVNAANDYFNESEFEYQVKNRRNETEDARRPRRPEHRRASRPTGFNGIHRRRNKRYF